MLANFIIDFDSTFVTLESLDELSKIALKNKPNSNELAKKITSITNAGMEGKIDFATSLAKRLALFQPTKKDIELLVQILKSAVTPSIVRNKQFFKNNKDRIYLITGGFSEYVIPVATEFGIDKKHIIGNSFIFDNAGKVIGYDKKNPLANDGGKTKAIKNLNLKGDIIVIGDGYTDYEVRKSGTAKKFFAFTENVNRPSVVEKADDVIFNFDELIFLYDTAQKPDEIPTGPLAIILGESNEEVLSQFEKEGFRVQTHEKVLSKKTLQRIIKDATILITDSRTIIDKELLENADNLLVIGRFGLTTAKIDIMACAKKGIPVFNAPHTNIRSVAELVMGEIIMLSRGVFEMSASLKKGVWNKSQTKSYEIKGKTLGIIGYGPVGLQLSFLAESFGMKVCFFDTQEKVSFGNTVKCASLEELLRTSDVISLHVEGNQTDEYPLTSKEFSLMKHGVLFINLSSGYIIPEKLLAAQLKSKKLGGLAVDVFSKEPKRNKDRFISPLQKFGNVILTPHIGGITEEAVDASGNFVVQKILDYITNGTTRGSINLPQLALPDHPQAHRFLHIHKNIPGVLAQINKVMQENKANIVGEYLKTNEQIGYVITDVTTHKSHDIFKDLEKISGTIKVREIY